VLLLASACHKSEPVPSFAEACDHPEARSAYVRAVVKPARVPSYVTRIDYVDENQLYALLPETRKLVSLPAMLTVNDDLSQQMNFGVGRNSRILILPKAFDRSMVDRELVFQLGLFDHELIHARLAHEGFSVEGVSAAALRSLPADVAAHLYFVVSELTAYRHELSQARRYALPPSYYQTAFAMYLKYYLMLFDPSFPPALRADLQARMFEEWMLHQSMLFSQAGDRWRFRVEEKIYELDPQVVAAIRQRFKAEDRSSDYRSAAPPPSH
jgi:hypothetical protein